MEEGSTGVVESGSGGVKDDAPLKEDASDSDLPLSSEESSDAAKGDENGESEPSGSGDAGFRGLSLPPDVSKKVSDESLSIPDSLSDLESLPSNSEELLHDTSAGSKGLSGL